MRGKPQNIRIDNGPEFISKALDSWAFENGISLHFIRPAKPTENGHIESFNGKLRDECLNQNWFTDLADAKEKIELWRKDYNEVRPRQVRRDTLDARRVPSPLGLSSTWPTTRPTAAPCSCRH